MRSTVTRLKPRTADFGTALSAFRVGDFLRCVESLSENTSLSARCLRARGFLRLGRYADVVACLEDLKYEHIPHHYAGELLALKCNALLLLKDPAVTQVLIEARARAFSSGFSPIECEVEFVAALEAWSRGDIEDALGSLQRVLDTVDYALSFGHDRREDYAYSFGYWRARAYDLYGLARGLRGDYAGQAAALASAFVEFDKAQIEDHGFETRLLANMAVLVRDLQTGVLADYVEERAEAIRWTEHTASSEFEVFQAIGWSHAKSGDHLGAFRHLRRSANCAPTVPLRILAILDRSFLAGELGENLSAGEELDHAVRLATQVDWENANAAERGALYALARQMAPVDKSRARGLWNRYTSLKTSVSNVALAGRGDRRQRADECSAHAAVLIAEEEYSRAISLLLESFEIWTDVGYSWRAASVALLLAELTGEGRYLGIVAREVDKQPNSFLAKRLAGFGVCAVS